MLTAAVFSQTNGGAGGSGDSDRVRQLEKELEKARQSHKQELANLESQHRAQLTASKRKQWCYNCEQEAIYHCCWNTAYCSTDCQQVRALITVSCTGDPFQHSLTALLVGL